MDRRAFLATLSGSLLAAPLAAEAQQAGKVYRIGSISAEMPTNPQGQGPFYDRMRELGWVHGQNYVVERRIQGDRFEHVHGLATEWVRSGVDMFLVPGVLTARRVQQVTERSRSSRLPREISWREGSRPALPDQAATSPASRQWGPRLLQRR
jgi:hypothetical protein